MAIEWIKLKFEWGNRIISKNDDTNMFIEDSRDCGVKVWFSPNHTSTSGRPFGTVRLAKAYVNLTQANINAAKEEIGE